MLRERLIQDICDTAAWASSIRVPGILLPLGSCESGHYLQKCTAVGELAQRSSTLLLLPSCHRLLFIDSLTFISSEKKRLRGDIGITQLVTVLAALHSDVNDKFMVLACLSSSCRSPLLFEGAPKNSEVSNLLGSTKGSSLLKKCF